MEMDNIRILLNRYYEGDATRPEIDRLVTYFRTEKEIPEDLEIDKTIFLSMESSCNSEYELPANIKNDLEESLDRIVSKKNPGNIFTINKWTYYVAAASVSILIISGFMFIQNNLPVRIIPGDPYEKMVYVVPEEKKVDTLSIQEKTIAENHYTSVSKNHIKKSSVRKSGNRIITSEDEANKMLASIFGKLDEKMLASVDAINKMDENIEDINKPIIKLESKSKRIEEI